MDNRINIFDEKSYLDTETQAKYVKPTEPLVQEHLEWFMDQKIGVFIHFGVYSQLGVMASWAATDGDAFWLKTDINPYKSQKEFREAYYQLHKSFNPLFFNPDRLASQLEESGFKYVVYTSKHHDGFCMYDSAYTDYKVTDASCPFHTNKNADTCKTFFDAVRKHNMGISLYFSKADWASPYYWVPGMQRKVGANRFATYDPAQYPWLWKKFVEYSHNQILELVKNYGKIDTLWLDAGWVSPRYHEDLKIGEVVEKARQYQPWLIAADRCAGNAYENYITPEQAYNSKAGSDVPFKILNVPWETCIDLGDTVYWSFNYDNHFMPSKKLIQQVIDIVAKGGNINLGIGLQPNGRFPEGALRSIKGMGQWMKKHGEAIYETRPCLPYRVNQYAYTENRKTGIRYAIYLPEENDKPDSFAVPFNKSVSAVLFNGEKVNYTYHDNLLKIHIDHAYEEEAAYVFTLIP